MTPFLEHIQQTLTDIEREGLLKRERLIVTPQRPRIEIQSNGSSRPLLNLCANNYLGLADHPEVIAAAHAALDTHGFGMASVRFICGTQALHRELERAIARFLGKDDAILFAAAFDANGGVFEPLLGQDDAIISDSLNHASIIDGVRLCKARRYRFANSNLDDLEDQLKIADRDGARFKLIATDGVFSMDGIIANLQGVCALAEKYNAIVLVDDCHATGFIGATGRGTPEHTGVGDRVDILTGTLGKALGGAMGGYVAASQPIIDLLRQRARPYLFSNSLAPSIVAGSMKALELVENGQALRERLFANTRRFRAGLTEAGFELLAGETPIIPVMLGEAQRAQRLAAELDRRGVYVAGFFYPVVPRGLARIRTQMSAALTPEDVDFGISAFADAGKALGII
jgi:glycine C-acetyltransferase